MELDACFVLCSSSPTLNSSFFPIQAKTAFDTPFHFECTISPLIYLVRFTVKCKSSHQTIWFLNCTLFYKGTTNLVVSQRRVCPSISLPFINSHQIIASLILTTWSYPMRWGCVSFLHFKFQLLWSYIHLSFFFVCERPNLFFSFSPSWSFEEIGLWDETVTLHLFLSHS